MVYELAVLALFIAEFGEPAMDTRTWELLQAGAPAPDVAAAFTAEFGAYAAAASGVGQAITAL